MTERDFRPSIPRKLDSLQIEDDKEKGFPGCARRRRCGALKTLLAAQRNVEACIALCEQTEFDEGGAALLNREGFKPRTFE